MKRFILNADGLGFSQAYNKAVTEGYTDGFLKSASIVPNGNSFEDAINAVLPKCPNLGAGIYLNLTEGRSLCSDVKTLTDEAGNFNKSFFDILMKSYNPKEKEFFADVEREFRRQIELVLSKTKVSHISSNSHIHAIPKIFNIVCRLSKEYGIKQIRTHFEKPYIVPDIHKHITKRYYKNLLKMFLLNFFTLFNEATANDYRLKTNDYLIGITYFNLLDAMSVSYALNCITNESVTVEVSIHPCRYEEGIVDNHFNEFMISKNKKLMSRVENLGYEVTNYVEED